MRGGAERKSSASRIERGVTPRRRATDQKGESIFARAKVSPVFATPKEAAKAFQPVILHLSVGELAFSTNKETAKCWKAARAFPSGVNLMALMAQFPCVRKWVNEQIDAKGAHPSDPQMVSEIVRQVTEAMRRHGGGGE